ncbi:MAG: UvrD-helicase domain-containing protein [Phycisphaerales bacterium]|nr:UvrD-helicase domain-containing protein [Phycisphaerales bacterium]
MTDLADTLLRDLTEPQAQAVRHTEGPLLILAAAGSGKTRVITRRIAYLIALGIPPWQILALTFTNKAAAEMRERVHHLLSGRDDAERLRRGLTITTFHALCARLLRRYAPLMEGAPRWGIRGDYTIYDTDDQTALMKRVMSDLQISTTNFPPRSMLGAVSNAKNELKDAEAFAREAHDFHARTVAKVFEKYEKALRAANAVDFDDLLLLTARLLRESAEARAEVQARWRYLMIDEYQDTNRAQFVIAAQLCGVDPDAPPGTPPNVCVVGDPDQSIYGWRGADIKNILDFEEHYPAARVIALGQNFRSTAPILAAADGLIRHNKQRKHKDLFTSRSGGRKPEVVLCRDEHHEARLAVDWLRRLLEEHPELAWKDCAIFYRNNALSRVAEDTLRASGIPYVIARGTAFYQREEIKDALAYLRVVANPADDVSLRRIINKPARKIGDASLDAVEGAAVGTGLPLLAAIRRVCAGAVRPEGVSGVAIGGMQRFVETLDRWTGAGSFMGSEVSGSLSELVDRVIKESGLEAMYKSAAAKSGADAEENRLDNLAELVTSAKDFEAEYDPTADAAQAAPREAGAPAPPPLLAMLRGFLESVALVADADAIDPASGAVTLMTLHAAKGLEFRCVAMIGLEEGLLPSMRALEADPNAEEERRLCFVGITRAMEHLLITSAKYRASRGLRERTIPSRFLSELPKDTIEISDQSDAFGDDTFDDDRHEGPRYEPVDNVDTAGRMARARAAAGGPGRPAGPAQPFPVGCAVRHPQFGVGKVVALLSSGSNARAQIQFRGVGTKTLVLQYARLERVD